MARPGIAPIILLTSLAGAPARADMAPSDAAIAHGVALRRERKDAEALAEFQRAYALEPTARALGQIALAEAALSQWMTAEIDLLRVMAADDPWAARQRDALGVALKEVQGHLGTLDLAGTPDAEVWIDGELSGHLPAPSLRVVAKRVAVEVRASGFESVRREIDVTVGGTIHEVFLLPPIAASPPPAALLPSPDASTVTRSSPANVLAWAAAGGSAVFLGGGVAATVIGNSAAARYNNSSECGSRPSTQCGDIPSQVHTAEAFEAVGYSLAGVAALTSAILFLKSPPRSEPRRTGAWCTPSLAGVACGYTY
jgi:hypothetical protein